MSYKYSPLTRGFYHDDQDAPDDAIELSDADYAHLIESQHDGREIVPGDGGIPSLAPILPPTSTDLTAYAASARYIKETGGIAVGSAQIDTSRDSQNMISNAYQFMKESGATSARYKSNSGWVTIAADQMKAIALAVGAHVQACFAAESDIDDKITAGTITTTAEIDAAFSAV